MRVPKFRWVKTGAEDVMAALVMARLAQGLTQTEVARRIGVSQAEVSRVENGKSPRLSTVLRYAGAIEVTLEITLIQQEMP